MIFRRMNDKLPSKNSFWKLISCAEGENDDMGNPNSRERLQLNIKQPSEVFYKQAVVKNLSIFKGKHLCWSLFLIKLQAFRSATWHNFIKNRFQHRRFSVNIVKFLKTPILKKICERSFIYCISGLQTKYS